MSDRAFTGHAVVNGKIRFVSVTQIKTFEKKSDGCPRKWAYSYVFGKKLAKTGALDKGIDLAKALEHFLKTGENVLPKVLQPAQKFYPTPHNPKTGKLDLEVEEDLGDIEKALYYRDEYLKFTPVELANLPLVGETLERIQRFAGLTACGIPVQGAADFRHTRGEYIDEEGVLRTEPAGAVVVEIGDQKVISRIWQKQIKSGPQAGTILPGWAKTSAQVCEDTQMVGYGRHSVDKYPGATHFRLSHVYAQKESKGAAKRTGLISVQQVLDRWHGNVEPVVREMIQVATAEKIEDVEPNLRACDSFTHVSPFDPTGKTMERGCGYKYICPMSATVVEQRLQNLLGTAKESAMSLFDKLDPSVLPAGMQPSPPPSTASAPPPPPVLDPVAERAAIDAEKARLRAQDSSRTSCPNVGCGVDCQPGWIKTDNAGGHTQCTWPGHAKQTVAPPPPPPPGPATGVTPPDAPPPAPLTYAAAPLPPAAVAEITDPKLRETVEQHAAEHKRLEEARLAQEQADKVAAGTNVWCATSNQTLVPTMEQALAGKYTCSCTKVFTLKSLKQEDGSFLVKRHKPVNKPSIKITYGEGVTPPPPDDDEEEETESFVAPPPPPPQTEMFVAPPPPPALPAPPVAFVAPPPPSSAEVAAAQETKDALVKEGLAAVRSMLPQANGTNGHAEPSAVAPPATGWMNTSLLKSIDATLKDILAALQRRGTGE